MLCPPMAIDVLMAVLRLGLATVPSRNLHCKIRRNRFNPAPGTIYEQSQPPPPAQILQGIQFAKIPAKLEDDLTDFPDSGNFFL